jgi:hypothetical protein
VVTDEQVRKLMQERNKHGEGKAALKAAMDRKTARKYVAAGRLPSEMKPPRTWRTRADPFEEEWPEIEGLLKALPELESKALFEYLQARSPERYEPGQLRTLQRHVRRWRAQHGPDQEVFFPQAHRAGEAGQSDFTNGNELDISIAGQPLPHLLYHFVLPYSNWEWATVARSESMLALRTGVQSSLFQLGRRPVWHQTDNSTAATHDLRSGLRGFNEEYEGLMRHLGMKPRTIEVGESHQNGDVEAANGALKRRLEQHLKLRGSRDFESVEEYQAWVQSVCTAVNRTRHKRVTEELKVMEELRVDRLREYDELDVPVTQWSTVRVRENVYSVPSRLKGETVRVRLFERQVEVWYAERLELCCERQMGRGGYRIDYRHIIWSLVRKPGAFARYRYREELFPTMAFRRAYDVLREAHEREIQADVEYLRVLHLAASTMQSEVEAGLDLLLGAGELPTADRVKSLMGASKGPEVPDLEPPKVDLSAYDALLGRCRPGKETGT